MKYLLSFPASYPSPVRSLTPEQLSEGLNKLDAGIKDGSVDAAYSKVGGGTVMVVNAASHESLTRILRQYHIANVEVTPLVGLRDVLEEYIAYHKNNPEVSKPQG
jgi:hypothetical protein